MQGDMYRSVITIHALSIIFFLVMPVLIGGFGNWILPLLLGAPDMRLPRINSLSFWLLPASLLLLVLSFFVDSGPAVG